MKLAISGARLSLGEALVPDRAVVIAGGKIEAVVSDDQIPADAEAVRLAGGILAPGFIDTQVNGGGGVLFNEVPTVEGLRTIAAAHRRYGTTGLLPTVISDEMTVIERAIRAASAAIVAGVPGILGIHVEGPMLAPSRHGIHDAAHMRGIVPELVSLLGQPRPGRTMVTLAPEIVGTRVVAELAERDVLVSAGHTEATYEQMREGFAAGVRGVTHLFNAMPAMANRAPGALGAALENQDAWCGIIVDGVHVHPAMLRLALKTRRIDRFMLVTDAMPPVGTSATRFSLQGREITVSEDRCVDEAGTLAGSNLTMDRAVRNLIEATGLSVPCALQLAAATPAAFLGMEQERGLIAPGQAADLVWLDDELQVQATWIAGRQDEPLTV